jgi:hypothetical protein
MSEWYYVIAIDDESNEHTIAVFRTFSAASDWAETRLDAYAIVEDAPEDAP